MAKANAATYSFGVAFDGCTMPGADEPLFRVEPGQMEFGLGIHGEPGITSDAWMPAPDLAARLVETVLAERPDDTDGRAAVLLNGLGATKYEELFTLFGSVASLLEQAGVTMVQPEVGELVTSLDMAGCSLSVTWLDDELETYWTAPAETPAFRRGAPAATERFTRRRPVTEQTQQTDVAEATEESRAAAEVARRAVAVLSSTVEEHKEELGRLDSVAGDGDHGIGMSRGARAATEAADAATAAGGGVQSVLAAAGAAFGDKAGGTSGILWGLLLDGVGQPLGNSDAVTGTSVARAVASSSARLQEFSKAALGDKTMLDALFPFVEALTAAVDDGTPLAQAWSDAARVATEAAEQTAALSPKVGRARPLAERSVGTPDPGAVSLALIVTAVGTVLADTTPTS